MSLTCEVVTVEVKGRPLPKGREVVHRRGKKFVYRWEWTVEPTQDIEFCYDPEILEEFTRAAFEIAARSPTALEEYIGHRPAS